MPPFRCCCVTVLLMWITVWIGAGAAAAEGSRPVGGIYSCTDAKGRRHTADRPIPECQDREQRLMNVDGSVRKILPPQMSPSERTDQEAREMQEAQAAQARQEASRRDRNLMRRYPNEIAHDAARNVALDDVRQSIAITQRRLAALAAERKPLLEEASSYVRTPVPLKLRQQLNANDAATQAQRDLVLTQQAELVRLNDLYDNERALLRRLWAGGSPGSVAPAASATPLNEKSP